MSGIVLIVFGEHLGEHLIVFGEHLIVFGEHPLYLVLSIVAVVIPPQY